MIFFYLPLVQRWRGFLTGLMGIVIVAAVGMMLIMATMNIVQTAAAISAERQPRSVRTPAEWATATVGKR